VRLPPLRVVRVAAIAGAGVLLGTVAAPAAPPAAPAPVTWSVWPDPFGLAFRSGTRTVASEGNAVNGPGGRLGYRLQDGSFHTLGAVLETEPSPGGARYTVATDEAGRTATVVVRGAGRGADVSLAFEPPTGIKAVFESFRAGSEEHYLGGGELPGPLDLRGQALLIKASKECGHTMPTSFFASSAGYGVYAETTAVGSLGFPGSDASGLCSAGPEGLCPLASGVQVVQLCVKGATLEYRLFVGTPLEVVSAYTAAVGRPLLPDPSQFELIKWRDIVDGPGALFADIGELRSRGIPIGWVLLDNPWEGDSCYGSMTFDGAHFHDPRGMIRALHARGVRLMLWISPLARRTCPTPDGYAPGALLGTGFASALDLTNPATFSTFEGKVRQLVALGVDGFKADRGDDLDLESLRLAGGAGVDLQNAYPLLFARAVAAAIRDAGGPPSFPTMFRSGAPGSAATVSGFWAGDQQGTFDGLRQAIHDGLSAGVAGFATWGSDTGGYSSETPPLTPEVFVRWAQFSAVSPIFEVGGTGANATFWQFGRPTVRLFRDAAVLHYELFPYLYGLARTAHATGIPILRPLALVHPDDPNAWRFDLEALVGPDLLAAPVTEAAGGGTAEAPVYLPAGTWVDLAAGMRVRGGTVLTRPTPLSQLPLYLRAGSAIPFAARVPAIWPRAWPTDALTLPGRGGWIYAPITGPPTRAADPAFGTLRATATRTRVRLLLRRAPRETQVLVTGIAPPREILVGGRPLRRAPSTGALRTAPAGWAVSHDPFPGVLLKLSPRRAAVAVELRLR
jgi:alpha-glucosidase (family GH31 glycosyl hydrolase)